MYRVYDQPEPTAPAARAGELAWVDADLELLDELAKMGMDLARALTEATLAKAAAVAAGEDARPLSPIEASRVALDFARISRAVRMTLVLRARVRAGEGNACTSADDPGSYAVFSEHPTGHPDFPDEDDWEDCMDYRQEEVRLTLEHAVTDPRHAPEEIERLREGIDVRLERERESETFNVCDIHETAQKIAAELGLSIRIVNGEPASGGYGRWVIARKGEEEETGRTVTIPDERPWIERRPPRKDRGPSRSLARCIAESRAPPRHRRQ